MTSITKYPGSVTQSANIPNTTETVSGDSGIRGSWGGMNNLKTCDSTYAYYDTPTNQTISEYLYLENFGFNIPLTATITGIKMLIRRKQVNSKGLGSKYNVTDETIKLQYGGAVIGVNDPHTDIFQSVPATETYGGSTAYLWYADWTPAKVNSSSFGATLRFNHPETHLYLYIDCVSITVFYTEPPTPPVPPFGSEPLPFTSLNFLPDHTVKINDLGFYAQSPAPDPPYDQIQLEEVDIENGDPVFYQTFTKFRKVVFKATLQGTPTELYGYLNSITNKSVTFASPYIGSFTAWVTYKPTFQDGFPNVMVVEFTIQKIGT